MRKNVDFDETFVKLKSILEPYESKLIVVADTADQALPVLLQRNSILNSEGIFRHASNV
jgi:hypothetical protein